MVRHTGKPTGRPDSAERSTSPGRALQEVKNRLSSYMTSRGSAGTCLIMCVCVHVCVCVCACTRALVCISARTWLCCLHVRTYMCISISFLFSLARWQILFHICLQASEAPTFHCQIVYTHVSNFKSTRTVNISSVVQ